MFFSEFQKKSTIKYKWYIYRHIPYTVCMSNQSYELKSILKSIFATYLRHPSSVLSIFISRIFATNSESIRSNIPNAPACCAEPRFTVISIVRTILSFTSMERWEKAAISNSFQPFLRRHTWSSRGNEVKCGMCLAQETSCNSCLTVVLQMWVKVF